MILADAKHALTNVSDAYTRQTMRLESHQKASVSALLSVVTSPKASIRMATTVLDGLGWTYIGLDIAFSVTFICGLVFLYMHRELPCIRIRRLPLLFLGLIPLHLYGVVCFLSYPVGPVVPCVALFWIMSIYLPFGIAMFHASNSQFLHVASRQKQFARLGVLNEKATATVREKEIGNSSDGRWRRLLRGSERRYRVDRMMLYIGLGLIVQFLLTVLVFFGSKKFHPSYGLWDWAKRPSDPQMRSMECSKGWEWWLSIVWQFFWAWLYAPYMLWKSRDVHDVHGWRLQTICVCLVGLPTSPMWLAALYAPGMTAVDTRFPPPSWFAAFIFALEVITIGFPIVEISKTHKLQQDTLDAIAAWEKRQSVTSPSLSTFSESSTRTGSRPNSTSLVKEVHFIGKTSFDSQRSDLYTMAGLENALRTNPVPLLQFAALRDFSGENVSFLTHVVDWRRAWLYSKVSITEHRRQQFVAAVSIYAHFVSPNFSEFPINISHQNITTLRELFDEAAGRIFCTKSISSGSPATPFDDVLPDTSSTFDLRSSSSPESPGRTNLNSVVHMVRPGYEDVFTDFPIPEGFKETVFDAAEKEIKYLVLTNTWPKFVNGAYATSQHDVEKQTQHCSWFRRTRLRMR